MEWLLTDDLWLARWLFTRSLAAIYLIAFSNVVLEFRPLLGAHGLTPAPRYLALVSFRRQPSLFHVHYSDRSAIAVAWMGVALSASLLVGVPQAGPVGVHLACWLVLWALYLSFVNVGQVWYGFGWESILLEAGFYAAFLGPDRVVPSRVGIVLVLWLLFRVEVGAGLIKVRGDRCWRDLTCLEYHHETQPLPGPFSWHAHHLPRWWHRMEVRGNYVAQLVAPFALFLPQPVASLAALIIIVTQGWLVLTGNFAWLNVVTIVLATLALGDRWLTWLPVDPPDVMSPPTWFTGIVVIVAVATVVMSWWPVRNMLSRSQVMNTRYNPAHLVGTYGAFGGITRQRYELVVEGTDEASPDASATWRAYAFEGKPGDPSRRPPQVAPYHLRLDWLMWFAAMSAVVTHAWMFTLLQRLLEGDQRVLRLLRHCPFPDRTPAAVRVVRYRYRYTTRDERRRTGQWWVRWRVGEPVPPIRLDERGELTRV